MPVPSKKMCVSDEEVLYGLLQDNKYSDMRANIIVTVK
jgi:hypothetical protein